MEFTKKHLGLLEKANLLVSRGIVRTYVYEWFHYPKEEKVLLEKIKNDLIKAKNYLQDFLASSA